MPLPGKYTESALEGMGVKFPKRENPFAKYFSKESPISTTQFEEPKMDDYFSSEDVLGRPTAKNTAQRGGSESEKMKAAYEALMNPKALAFFEKGKGPMSGMGEKSIFGSLEEIPRSARFTVSAATGKTEAQEALERNLAKQGATKDIFGGTPFSEVIKKYSALGISDVEPMAWSGGGTFKQTPAQTSSSNILQQGHQYTLRDQYGKPLTDREGNIKQSSEVTMSQAASDFERVYGFKGSEEQVRRYAYGEYSEPR